MSCYAWEKFHLAAEMLRDATDKRLALSEAFTQEIAMIREEDVPPEHKEKIDFIFNKLSLPDNVETLSGVPRHHHLVYTLSESEIDAIINAIFELESAMKIH